MKLEIITIKNEKNNTFEIEGWISRMKENKYNKLFNYLSTCPIIEGEFYEDCLIKTFETKNKSEVRKLERELKEFYKKMKKDTL